MLPHEIQWLNLKEKVGPLGRGEGEVERHGSREEQWWRIGRFQILCPLRSFTVCYVPRMTQKIVTRSNTCGFETCVLSINNRGDTYFSFFLLPFFSLSLFEYLHTSQRESPVTLHENITFLEPDTLSCWNRIHDVALATMPV